MSGKRIEKILTNLAHSEEEIRTRALSHLLDKLKLKFQDLPEFLEEHHHIFGIVMTVFNKLQLQMKEPEITGFLELIGVLVSCETGRVIGGQYQIANFLDQFLGFLMKKKFRRAVEISQNIIRTVLRSKSIKNSKVEGTQLDKIKTSPTKSNQTSSFGLEKMNQK